MKGIIVRSSGVIIRDKKILLVSAGKRPFFWTPGGKLEPGETALDALEREFYEELGVKITKTKHYFDYICSAEEEEDNRARQIHVFLVEFAGEPSCAQEISSMIWASHGDIMNKKIILQSGIKNYLLPKLIKDGLL